MPATRRIARLRRLEPYVKARAAADEGWTEAARAYPAQDLLIHGRLATVLPSILVAH